MSNTKHTPGPWRWVEHKEHHEGSYIYFETAFGSGCLPALIGANDEPVFSGIGNHDHDASLSVPEENARLIAAAPDLLEALDYALWAADPSGSWTRDGSGGDATIPEWVSRARAAIAKATVEHTVDS